MTDNHKFLDIPICLVFVHFHLLCSADIFLKFTNLIADLPWNGGEWWLTLPISAQSGQLKANRNCSFENQIPFLRLVGPWESKRTCHTWGRKITCKAQAPGNGVRGYRLWRRTRTQPKTTNIGLQRKPIFWFLQKGINSINVISVGLISGCFSKVLLQCRYTNSCEKYSLCSSTFAGEPFTGYFPTRIDGM